MDESLAVAGFNGKAYISDDGVAYTELAQLQDCELNVTADMLDASTHATVAAGWKQKKPGMLDWTATIGTLRATGDEANQKLYDCLVQRKPITFRFDPEGSTNALPRYVGVGYIKGWKETSPATDLVKLSVDVEGNGPLQLGEVAAS